MKVVIEVASCAGKKKPLVGWLLISKFFSWKLTNDTTVWFGYKSVNFFCIEPIVQMSYRLHSTERQSQSTSG